VVPAPWCASSSLTRGLYMFGAGARTRRFPPPRLEFSRSATMLAVNTATKGSARLCWRTNAVAAAWRTASHDSENEVIQTDKAPPTLRTSAVSCAPTCNVAFPEGSFTVRVSGGWPWELGAAGSSCDWCMVGEAWLGAGGWKRLPSNDDEGDVLDILWLCTSTAGLTRGKATNASSYRMQPRSP